MSTRAPGEPNCFGFYFGNSHTACSKCLAARRCKAVLVSDSFQILDETVQLLVQELPDGNYRDSDRVSEIVKQLINPVPIQLSQQEQELVGILEAKPEDLQDMDI